MDFFSSVSLMVRLGVFATCIAPLGGCTAHRGAGLDLRITAARDIGFGWASAGLGQRSKALCDGGCVC